MASRKQDYEVGFGKPPKEHQFRKGKSGNPNGRRKGSKNHAPRLPLALNPVIALLMKELGEPMGVILEGKQVDLPALQVIVRKLKIDAARGDYRKMKLFLEMARAAADQDASER